ncbi:MAG: tRNA lysidine(34) synthetase TilS [Clostridiales bacterium]|nr:tRNA lysidine(34) synthetase TilS [Clostridiales bacterium]
MCLFNVLLELKEELGLTIHPVHVNHKFRPGAAERDQQYVEDLCKAKGLKCHSFVMDCNRLATEEGMTSEEAGRKARYDAFYSEACQAEKEFTTEERAEGTQVKIAVAQNADDQAETILFRLLRGTGTDGLAGIAYSRQEREFTVIRPLLDVSRDKIEAYCEKNRLKPVTDHTNQETLYTRNKIRLELLPYMEREFNENIKDTLNRLGKIAREDKDYIWQQVEVAYKELKTQAKFRSEAGKTVVLDREGLNALHKAVRHRVILKALGQIGLTQDVTEERLRAADKVIEMSREPKIVEFPHGYHMEVTHKQVKFR